MEEYNYNAQGRRAAPTLLLLCHEQHGYETVDLYNTEEAIAGGQSITHWQWLRVIARHVALRNHHKGRSD
ncbi:MAG: hypothetical protein KAZ98_04375 [Prevotella sp.]|nr:hypothetical protein [Prevotella sp.]